MGLSETLERQGGNLFRWRGHIPVILFLAVIPVLYFNRDNEIVPLFNHMITAAAVLICLAGFVVRAWTIGTTPKGTSGRNTREQVAETLNTHGIYSVVRHPLYLGNFLMWVGITLFVMDFWFFMMVLLFFWLYYERIMMAEESFLKKKFDRAFMDWSSRVPAFFPCLRTYHPGTISFSMISVLRREYSGILATVFSFAYIDHLRFFFREGAFQWDRPVTFVLAVVLLITFILRWLKHNTDWLDEKDRS